MDHQADKKSDIIKHIINGTIKIDSEQEFQAILDIFPADPSLHRAYADLLWRKKSTEKAARAYKRTTDIFVNSGMILQAIASKIMEWTLSKPSNKEVWAFYSALRKCDPQDSPFKKFFEKMTYPEMVSFLKMSEYVRYPAGKLIMKFGDPEDNLYFIVSGTVHETPCRPSSSGKEIVRKSPITLTENDFLGRIYPFDQKNTSSSDFETYSRAELIKLSRERLISLCKNFPGFEMKLNQLYQLRSQPEKDTPSHVVRKTTRYKIIMDTSVEIYHDESGVSPLVINGTTSDISLSGICVYLDTKYWKDPPMHLIGKTAKTKISLPSESISISILGKLVWFKQIMQNGKIADIMGIQFKEMSPKLSGILLVMANIMNDGK